MEITNRLMGTHELENFALEHSSSEYYENIQKCISECKRTTMFTNVLHRGNLQLFLENPSEESINKFKAIYPI